MRGGRTRASCPPLSAARCTRGHPSRALVLAAARLGFLIMEEVNFTIGVATCRSLCKGREVSIVVARTAYRIAHGNAGERRHRSCTVLRCLSESRADVVKTRRNVSTFFAIVP